MTATQKIIKYAAMALAAMLAVAIIGGIATAVFAIGSFLDRENAVIDEVREYAVDGEVTNLDVSVSAANFVIKTSDKFSVESNLGNLTVKNSRGTLQIREKNSKFGTKDYSDAVLTVYIPDGFSFGSVDISTGASRFEVEFLEADRIDLELGAGEVVIKHIVANREIDIEGGAGKISIQDGMLKNLSFEMGLGEASIRAVFSGSSELDLGMGRAEITLIGQEDDYRIKVNRGIGNASVNGTAVDSNTTVGSGTNYVEINGGVGEVDVRIEK